MNFLAKLSQNPVSRVMLSVPKRAFYYPDSGHHIQDEPHVLAKRIIKCVGTRLRETDPYRWEGVPITFNTHWNDEGGELCLRTCILIHDAIEREFCIDIDDKKILLTSVDDCFDFVLGTHGAV